MGRITEIRKNMDGGFELTAEFNGETFWDPWWKVETNKESLTKAEIDLSNIEWKPSLHDPDVWEIELGDVYDRIGIPCSNRRAYVWTCSKYDIDCIYHNNTKNTTVVKWSNGDKTKVKMADGENSYIYNAVAAAVMKRKYGSNSAFKSYIKKNCGRYGDAIYQVIAREQVGVIYGGFEKFKQIVDEKLVLQG